MRRTPITPMSKALLIAQVLLFPNSIFLGLKLTEMCICIATVIRKPEYAQELLSAAWSWNDPEYNETEIERIRRHHNFPAREDWPIARFFFRIRPPFGGFLVKLFKFRWLVFIQILSLLIADSPFFLAADTLLLGIAVWIVIICLVTYRLVFGYADTTFRKTLAQQQAVAHMNAANRRQQRVRDFFFVFVGTFTLLILAYAAIFTGLDKLAGSEGAFEHVPHDWSRPLHFLYFSIATVATVGYGDIFPKVDSLVARFATGSEILAGYMLLIVW